MRKWRLVQSVVLQHIAENSLGDGDELPRDRFFAVKANCSMQPVMRAMDDLARRGMIDRRPGAATRVLGRQPIIDDHELSFRHTTCNVHGRVLSNRVFEISSRQLRDDDDHVFEREAVKALGLKKSQRFHVIGRVRFIDGEPRAIHRSYLNPAYFPDTFLADHNFEAESLIEIFNGLGYRIESRQTALQARFPSLPEQSLLRIGIEPVLEAQQELKAIRKPTKQFFTIEFLHACYVKWRYWVGGHRQP